MQSKDSFITFVFRPSRLIILAVLALAGCRYPVNIERPMADMQGGELNIGLSENPPWVINTDQGPAGLEVEIIQALAENMDATINWHWDSEGNLLAALSHYQLDLVIGGLTQDSNVSALAAPTKAYYKSRYLVGVPEGTPIPSNLEGVEVTVPVVNHIARALKKEGAIPRPTPDLGTQNEAVANPSWWLHAHNYQIGDWEIATDQHVMALPKGENAWMLAVQRHLNSYPDIEQRLQRLEAGR
ncbi:transporter substrate-binding domain-containing protein [Halomonas sp. FME20]|uniref:Transporter substrate-binding domain-containing protein n=2 Tax=Halomonadaceae TaxID=28256 RepID=A0ABR9FV82_9GAMM|nr:transporter substrate-binding domain-containing protein [Halomonas colorata]